MNFSDLQKLYDVDESIAFEKGILVFDTSALLDLYFYSEATALDILEKSYNFFGKSRMFLPSQVKFEFDKNREKILLIPKGSYDGILDIKNKYGSYEKISKEVDNFFESIDTVIRKIVEQAKNFNKEFSKKDKHPYLSDEIIEQLNTLLSEFTRNLSDIPKVNPFLDLRENIEKEIETKKSEIELRFSHDNILDSIGEYFTLGRDYSYSELLEIVKEGEIRYNSKIPPGYRDKDSKVGFQKYGDLILWKQLMEYASESNLPCIFVSNDTKEDWNEFLESDDAKKSKKIDSRKPRVELLLEFQEKVNNHFKKLTLKDFIYQLEKQSPEKFSDSTKEELELSQLNTLIIEESEEFIESIESEIIAEAKTTVSVPEESIHYDIENEDIYISDISVVLPSESSDTTVEYDIEVRVLVEMLYWEYWGRDDETKQILLSPTGTATYSGRKTFKIFREVEVNLNSGTINTSSYDMELLDDDVSYEQESWGEKEDRGLHY